MKKIALITTTILLLSGCSKNNTAQNAIENQQSKLIDYKCTNHYSDDIEIGMDNQNNAYITDLSRNIQIVVVCHIKFDYRNVDFAEQTSTQICDYYSNWDKEQLRKYGESRIDFCMKDAFKIETEYDTYFKKELKKYYVYYKEPTVYALFNK